MVRHVPEIVSNENRISVELEVPVTRIQEKLYKMNRTPVVFFNGMLEKWTQFGITNSMRSMS